jgi:hypothetical protein
LDCPQLLRPERLYSRAEVLTRPSAIPKTSGVYAWYFREIPDGVPVDGCIGHEDLTLLYTGIAPKPPPRNGGVPSRQTLCHRIRYHFRGNAAGSTLRLTLGCLLSGRLRITLRRVGSGARLTFAGGEGALSEWMGDNAYVAFLPVAQPWFVEKELVSQVPLPLNLDMNAHPFRATLSAIRGAAREQARRLPIVPSKYDPLNLDER